MRLTLTLLAALSLPSFSDSTTKAMQTVRKYCGACHAIEPIRFIDTEDDAELWRRLRTNWRTKILSVLSWPVTDPLALQDPASPPRYMPVGSKRHLIVREMIESVDARQFLKAFFETNQKENP